MRRPIAFSPAVWVAGELSNDLRVIKAPPPTACIVATNEHLALQEFLVTQMTGSARKPIELHGRGVQIADVVAVARYGARAVLSRDARLAMEKSAMAA